MRTTKAITEDIPVTEARKSKRIIERFVEENDAALWAEYVICWLSIDKERYEEIQTVDQYNLTSPTNEDLVILEKVRPLVERESIC